MSWKGPRYKSRTPRSNRGEPYSPPPRSTSPRVRIQRPDYEETPAPQPSRVTKKKSNRVKLTSTAASRIRGTRRFTDTLKADFKSGRIPLLIGLVLVAGLVFWALTGSNFKLTNIKVTGSKYLDAQGVIAATGVNQQNYFLLNEADVINKLRQKPFIQDVKISKALPNELKVEVVDRKTGAVWKIGGLYYMVDPDGVILESAPELKTDVADMPLINSLDPTQPQIGDKVDGVAISSAPILLDFLKTAGIKIASLDYSPTTGLIVVSAGPDGKPGPWKALFGTSAELDKKMNLLKALLARSDLKWSFADLRFTDKTAIS